MSPRSILTQPFGLRGLTLPGRVLMSPMGRAHAPTGVPDPAYAGYFLRRARGGVGLMVTGAAAIGHPLADYDGTGPLLHGGEPLAAWRAINDTLRPTGVPLVAQLWHTGMARKADMLPGVPIGPSGFAYFPELAESGKAMDQADFDAVLAAYAEAASATIDAGFAAIEVHAGHGFLLDQFLWPQTNRRTDDYGGSPANRARFVADVVAACRAAVGEDVPILLRLSQFKIDAYDAVIAETPDDLAALVEPLAGAGVDLFDCSQRDVLDPVFAGSPLNLAGWVKKLTGKPAIGVGSVGIGGLFTEDEAAGDAMSLPRASLDRLDAACERMAAGEFDLLAVGRALLADADFVRKATGARDAPLNDLTFPALVELL